MGVGNGRGPAVIVRSRSKWVSTRSCERALGNFSNVSFLEAGLGCRPAFRPFFAPRLCSLIGGKEATPSPLLLTLHVVSDTLRKTCPLCSAQIPPLNPKSHFSQTPLPPFGDCVSEFHRTRTTLPSPKKVSTHHGHVSGSGARRRWS